ncbi:hypothetical protein EV207_105119 [Scopulibacillus darangshiensis]|uniref:Cof subfamily protein (Haloacid dehalogenase superfamily)/HAD superfamily hydrolase (TIGR01484 family) n=1 Tax=Scopulibacillus darangshiensis TaxID=442528 RepID=A0A4R2P6Q6_9BACL|nr:Cof-type HAD-IIB family hydrolase [Scopulibacillus darangshiensis]TCP30590.1 hypothetical protein EV207_105119 [Scopulibacillus darangshiensis]
MKLIAIDLDGTLLTSDGTISLENAKAIREAQREGVTVAISSGRQISQIDALLAEANLRCPAISSNGAAVFTDDHQLIKSCPLHSEQAKRIYEILEVNDAFYRISTNKGVHVLTNGTDRLTNEIEQLKHMDFSFEEEAYRDIVRRYETLADVHPFENAVGLFQHDIVIYKFLIQSFQKEKLERLASDLKAEKEICLTSSGIDNLEINHIDAQKGYGLMAMANHLGISMEQTAAIGDNFNDVSMFQKAGLSVAMGNGEKDIKEMCDIITLTNDDNGVAYAIRNYILNPERT